MIDNSATAPQTLGTSGTIYVADGPRASKGYIFGADRIGLVVKGGMNLVQMGNCDTAAITVGSGSNFCLIQGDTRNFTWIEGDFNDPSPVANSSGLLFKNSNHNTIRQSSFNQFYTGMYFYNSQNNQVRHSATSNSGFMGLKFSNSANDNHVEYFRSSNETQSGIQLVTSSRNVMQHLSIHNNGSDGVSFVSAGENYLTAAVISGSNKGLSLSTAHQNTIGLVTIGNMSNQGVYINGNNNTLHNVLVGNIAAQGFAISTGSTNFLVNTVSTHTTGAGYVVQNAGSADNRLQGYVGLGNNTQLCQLAGGAVVAGGVIDLTCTTTGTDGSSTYTGNNSSAVLWTGLNLSTSFVGNLLTDDFTNGSDSSGSANYATTLDWWGFDNNFRGWGRNSPAMTGPAQGRCNSGSCRIWDWQLTSSDTWLLNRSGALNGINSAFVKGGTCPVEVGGSVTTTDQKPTPNTYLTNAVEIIGDFVGDEDGLCESNEGCVYTPNVGAYQGHGEITGADYCAFQNGTVSNVYMMAHPLNGI